MNSLSLVSWHNHLKAGYRLLIGLGLAGIAFGLLLVVRMEIFTRLVAAFDVFALVVLFMSWFTFFTTGHEHIRQQAQEQDAGRTLIFIIIIILALACLLAVIVLLGNSKNIGLISQDWHTPISFLAVCLSWFLIHTVFTLRYAHLYYGNNKIKPNIHQGGVDFPGDGHPDYLDFAYFSFVIGMTAQVSDIAVISTEIRRLVLLHSILSFGFNTGILALTINAVANLV